MAELVIAELRCCIFSCALKHVLTSHNLLHMVTSAISWNACGSIKLYFVFALMSYFSVLFLLLFLQDAGSHMLFLQYLHWIYVLIELTISFSKWTYLPKHRKFNNKNRSWKFIGWVVCSKWLDWSLSVFVLKVKDMWHAFFICDSSSYLCLWFLFFLFSRLLGFSLLCLFLGMVYMFLLSFSFCCCKIK